MIEPSRNAATPRLAYALTAGSAFAFGGVPLLAVELSRNGIGTPSLMFWRYCIALSLLLPLALVLRQPLAAGWRNGGRALFAVAVTLGTFQTFCYFQAVERMPTSVAVLVFFLYPLFALLVQRIGFGRRAAGVTIAACVLIGVGVALMVVGIRRLQDIALVDWSFAVLAPACYGVYVVLIARQTGRLQAVSGATFIQVGLLTGYAIVVATLGLTAPATPVDWARTVAVATIGSALPMLAVAYSLPRLGPAGFGVVSSLELVTVVLLGVWLLGEDLLVGQWLGVACVLAGILIYRPPRSPER